ncbi:hypothetical protein SanaruYs_27040 [Chryseotalea sanaruensis]|uniref:Uncharacterized protein n=1 Tax=Chryseotalea sanaruensis TaxID=2482724 RepID=A0A401UC58_9BACT|nr:hypothetical protein SanaruYs_27040 [Chryseotalea sanaruensis]
MILVSTIRPTPSPSGNKNARKANLENTFFGNLLFTFPYTGKIRTIIKSPIKVALVFKRYARKKK